MIKSFLNFLISLSLIQIVFANDSNYVGFIFRIAANSKVNDSNLIATLDTPRINCLFQCSVIESCYVVEIKSNGACSLFSASALSNIFPDVSSNLYLISRSYPLLGNSNSNFASPSTYSTTTSQTNSVNSTTTIVCSTQTILVKNSTSAETTSSTTSVSTAINFITTARNSTMIVINYTSNMPTTLLNSVTSLPAINTEITTTKGYLPTTLTNSTVSLQTTSWPNLISAVVSTQSTAMNFSSNVPTTSANLNTTVPNTQTTTGNLPTTIINLTSSSLINSTAATSVQTTMVSSTLPTTLTSLPSSSNITLGLVNYWPIRNDVKDYITSLNLTWSKNGTTSFTFDRFNRSNSAIYLNDTYYLAPSGVYFNGSFTIMGWIKPIKLSNDSCFFSFGNGPASDNVYICLAYAPSNGPYYGIWNDSASIAVMGTSQQLTPNTWTHISATWDGAVASMYLNGVLVANKTGIGRVRNVTRSQCYIGMSNWPNYPMANACFDDIRIYNRALNQTEIWNQYQYSSD